MYSEMITCWRPKNIQFEDFQVPTISFFLTLVILSYSREEFKLNFKNMKSISFYFLGHSSARSIKLSLTASSMSIRSSCQQKMWFETEVAGSNPGDTVCLKFEFQRPADIMMSGKNQHIDQKQLPRQNSPPYVQFFLFIF